MAHNPEDCYYTKEHEWIRVEDGTGIIGITDHAQQALGDVVYVEMPSLADTFDAGEVFGNIESVKAVSELFMPASGEVIEINEDLADTPELVNQDPYNDGWMIKIKLADPRDVDALMSVTDYEEFLKEEK